MVMAADLGSSNAAELLGKSESVGNATPVRPQQHAPGV